MFVFDKPAVKSRMQHKHELAIKRINNDNVDTFHKLWMPIASVCGSERRQISDSESDIVPKKREER